MFHPFDADQPIADFPEIVALSLDDQDFHTMVGVQMNVDCGDNKFEEIVLQAGQDLGKLPGVMVVDDGNRPHGLLARFPFLLYQAVADQVANRLRSILATLFP